MLCFRDIVVVTHRNDGGSGTIGTSDEEIHMMIHKEVAAAIWEAIPEMLRSIMTTLIEMFHEGYVVVTEAAAAAAATAAVTTVNFWSSQSQMKSTSQNRSTQITLVY